MSLARVTLPEMSSDPSQSLLSCPHFHIRAYSLRADIAIFSEPDGYLQWDAIDTVGLHFESPETVSSDSVSKLFRATKIAKGTGEETSK
jgi:hypothetical protein